MTRWSAPLCSENILLKVARDVYQFLEAISSVLYRLPGKTWGMFLFKDTVDTDFEFIAEMRIFINQNYEIDIRHEE